MTARAFQFDYEFLAQVSTRIVNAVKVGIPAPDTLSRSSIFKYVYDINYKL